MLLLFTFCFAAWPSSSLGNKASDSHLTVTVGEEIHVRWDIALRDLEMLVGLDLNLDGQITWGEVRQQEQTIFANAVDHLDILLDGVQVQLEATAMSITEHSDGNYAVIEMNSGAIGRFQLMEIHYDFFFDVDKSHRCIVEYCGDYGRGSYLIGSDRRLLRVPEGGTHWLYLILTYIRVGAGRVWCSYSAIVFLIALILPSVWQFEEERLKYVPAEKLRPSIVGLFGMVTCLTFAQSLTLWHAGYGVGTQSFQWVEPFMAAIVVASAMHNMYPKFRYWVWGAAIAFGLLLGFQFAGYLKTMGLPSAMLPLALFGFSIGVELALLCVAVVVFPVAFFIRRKSLYDQFVFHGGSTFIVILGAIWLIETLSGSTIIRVPDSIQRFF
jgi:hypothetical protein